MSDYQPILCSLHDHLEVLCLYQCKIKVELSNGDLIEGQANTTETTADKQEFLIIRILSGEEAGLTEEVQSIRLDRIMAIDVLAPEQEKRRIEFR